MSKENLQGIYTWLKTAPVPKMIDEALRFYGVKNSFNDPNNPVIMLWENILQVDIRKFYEYNACSLYDTPELGELGYNNSKINSQHTFGNNLRVITEGHFVPWCGLFMGIVAHNSGMKSVEDPLYPVNWGDFGSKVFIPMLGDVLIFIRHSETRKKAGYVGLYIGEDSDCYHVLGGNENDTVRITRILKSRLHIARRPKYKTVPDCIKTVSLPSNCNVTKNTGILTSNYKTAN